jgi:predicted ester cyclase
MCRLRYSTSIAGKGDELREDNMSIEDNKAVVRRFFEEYWNEKKLDTLGEFISPGRIHHFGEKAEPHGPDHMRMTHKLWYDAAPDFQYHIEQLIGEGDRVAALVTFTGTHTGTHRVAGRTAPPSNNAFREAEMFVFRIADGKIVESWAAWDRLSFLEQIGAVART